MAFPFFTFGGLFYWVDKHSYAGWRIQVSIWNKKCRLLDPYNIKRASGSFEDCFETMLSFFKAWEVSPVKSKAVVFIHGLFQSPTVFEKNKVSVQDGFEPILFSYPMFRFSLVKSAMALNAMLDRREDIAEINFVASGMGGLILRQAVELNPKWLSRIKRSILVGVPSQGYSFVEKYQDKKWYQLLFSEAGENISPKTIQSLMPMAGEFCCIAGGKGNDKGYNPFLKKDNDGILTVENAFQQGAKENYLAFDVPRYRLLSDDTLIELMSNFLNKGRLGSGVRIRAGKDVSKMWDY